VLVPSPEAVADERHAMMRAGRTYHEWAAMTKWQRAYFLTRSLNEAKGRIQKAQRGLPGLIGALVSRLLGV
jgi:hypothetical protein